MELNGNGAHIEPSEMEQLLATENYQAPQRGDIKKGVILSISPTQIIVDIGLKKEGVVPASDLAKLGPETLSKLAVGDEVFVTIERPSDRDGDLIVSMHKAWMEEDWKIAEDYLKQGKIWEVEVSGYNKGGLIIPFGNLRGFVPASQLPGTTRGGKQSEEHRPDQFKEHVGRKMPVKVIEVDRQRKRLIISARAAEREWRDYQRRHLFDELTEGSVRHGVVSSLCDFGAFVDLGGVDGLVHVSELAWHRIQHPKEVLKVGDEVDVYILRVDREKQRVGLSIKRLAPEPWTSVTERYAIDQLVQATITNVVDFGAFAMIEDGVEGLIHVSELSETVIQHPNEVVKVGDQVTVSILRIDSEHRRLGLSMKRAREEELDWTPDGTSET